MNLNEEFRKLSGKQQGCLVVALLFITFIVTVSILVNNDQATRKDWREMTSIEKEEWIKDYLKSPNDAGYQLIAMMDARVRSHFNYPKEVDYDFGGRPTFSNAVVALADSALVVVSGQGTAKNAFGVRSGFKYQCILTINPNKLRLENVIVSED